MSDIEKISSEVTEYLRREPFGTLSVDKSGDFLELVNKLTSHHLESCTDYRRIVLPLFPTATSAEKLDDVPYLPVRLFKLMSLSSVTPENTIKTMTSSGTTGQAVSRIFLDKSTSLAQTRALSQIMGSLLGKSRMPMLIIDSTAVVKDRAMFSARGAGIRGFSVFGKDVEYVLDDNMQVRVSEVESFLGRHQGSSIFLFGFTFMIWEYMCEALRLSGRRLDIPDGILLHGGGWKKLEALKIGNDQFKASVRKTTGVTKVVNYYGMVEQTGSIFVECDRGFLHSSAFSEVLVRDPVTLRPANIGIEGVIQVISMLPMSYPGHSILTEDLGTIVGNDDCACGRLGRYFLVSGRIKDAEIRGCSDTYVA